jgi:4-hydroxybenzoate polyprenyltransferase
VWPAFKLLRPEQWSKSLFVFTGFVYSGDDAHIPHVFAAAIAFSFVASSVYIYNDMRDLESDKNHPDKRKRALAAGVVSVSQAWGIFFVCIALGFLIGYCVSLTLVYVLALYVCINFVYNHGVKSIPYLDVCCIAFGFLLRVMAGTVAIGVPFSRSLAITITLVSLYIASCKRYLELHRIKRANGEIRRFKYNQASLRAFIALCGILCLLSYTLYIFKHHYHELFYFLSLIPAYIAVISFYEHVIHNEHETDDPIKVVSYNYITQISLLTFIILDIVGFYST